MSRQFTAPGPEQQDAHEQFIASAQLALRSAAADLFAAGWPEAEVFAEVLDSLPWADEIDAVPVVLEFDPFSGKAA